MKENKSVIKYLRLTPSTYAEVEQYLQKHSVTFSQMARAAISLLLAIESAGEEGENDG